MRVWIGWLVALTVAGCSKPEARVVVYCAQDQEFAEGVFADFTKDTQVAVAPKFDTEANKSVSLAAELEQEADRPRCDVHWNNEILGTIRLARQGVYEPYESAGREPFPDWTKAGDLAGVRRPGPGPDRQHEPGPGGRPAEVASRPDRPEVEGEGGDGQAAVRHDGDAGGVPVRSARAGRGEGVLPRAEGERREARPREQAGGDERVGAATVRSG